MGVNPRNLKVQRSMLLQLPSSSADIRISSHVATLGWLILQRKDESIELVSTHPDRGSDRVPVTVSLAPADVCRIIMQGQPLIQFLAFSFQTDA
ncbi:hypothetical protein N7539_003333 [Penicillium diatomitis]|uniref:Uncharacterized protein n=1 Tax=Penicillium diatomitis TaxID=2819901 RepID=A0A9W9XGD8_9EURO|nr:uncharacterized protein N7539_003333 [Penicillium diatomitis]KAJ5491766.1 hypothetical protein N7539_003333 [Penicillium diatomitis]